MSESDRAYWGPWIDRAACKGTPWKVFAPERMDSIRKVRAAKRICFGCPVRLDCRRWIDQFADDHAIFGGLTPKERKATTPEEGEALIVEQAAGWGIRLVTA